MAILFNPQALNAFAKFNVGNNNAGERLNG